MFNVRYDTTSDDGRPHGHTDPTLTQAALARLQRYVTRRTTVREYSGSPYLDVTLTPQAPNAPRFRALLDTGATHSIIRDTALARIGEVLGINVFDAWPLHRIDGFSVVVGDGKALQPAGAVVMELGVRTLDGSDACLHFPFLIMEGITEDIILGTDWEAEVNATHFSAAGLLGLSLTDASQARYAAWAMGMASTRSLDAAMALPMTVFSHMARVDRVTATESNYVRAIAKAIAADDHDADVAPTPHASVSSRESTATPPSASEAPPKERSADAASRATRPDPAAAHPDGVVPPLATLRSVHALVIPPRSEVGPVPTTVHWRTHERRP
jgi:hypothetical protein